MISQEMVLKIKPIFEKNDVSFAGVFGSRARGEERPDSDIDILVSFNKPKGLFELVGLEYALSETLKIRVDLVTEGALTPDIKPEILKDLKPLYGQR